MLSRQLIEALAKSGRIEIVRALKANHDRSYTINELARASGVPVMTTWRAVKELKGVGLVKTRKIGNATAVTLSEDRELNRILKLLPEADPHRAAAEAYSRELSSYSWLVECKLFGAVGRGEHGPGEDVDVAVVYDDSKVSEDEVRNLAAATAEKMKGRSGIMVVPLCVSAKQMSKKGGFASELRDKETIWPKGSSRNSRQ